MEFIIFLAVAALAVASGVSMVLMRNAMYSALFLVLAFFCQAVLYILMGAFFLAVVQVAVYAGAIMVLMLFVIMLLNVAQREPVDRRLGIIKPFGVIAGLVLLVELGVVGAAYGRPIATATPVTGATGVPAAPAAPVAAPPVRPVLPAVAVDTTFEPVGAAEVGHTQLLAVTLFSRFLLPFEVTSILLLGAILGAAVLARKRPDVEHAGRVRIK